MHDKQNETMTKKHQFAIEVESQSRETARTALLCAFATRDPDGCKFQLKDNAPPKTGSKAQRIAHWEETIVAIVGHYKRLDAACDAARDAGCLSTEGKLHDAIWDGFSGMLAMLDDDDWISWFIYENECGKRAMKAGFDGKTRPIRTARQLAKLITEHESKA